MTNAGELLCLQAFFQSLFVSGHLLNSMLWSQQCFPRFRPADRFRIQISDTCRQEVRESNVGSKFAIRCGTDFVKLNGLPVVEWNPKMILMRYASLDSRKGFLRFWGRYQERKFCGWLIRKDLVYTNTVRRKKVNKNLPLSQFFSWF